MNGKQIPESRMGIETTRGSERANEKEVEKRYGEDKICYSKALSSQPNDIQERNESKEKLVNEDATTVHGQEKLSNTELKKMERKMRQKLKKEMKKEEKKLQREEDIRKNRFPKDQKVRLIDRSVMEKLFPTDTNSLCNKSVVSIDGFPALGEVKIPTRRTARSFGTNETPSSADSSKTDNKIQDFNQVCPSNAEDKVTTRKPKRHDLIHIDIGQILKAPDTGVNLKNEVKPQKKVDVVPYCGNILDSDNPERKRGKQRETPKAKKLSHLKTVILQDRKSRALQREIENPENKKGIITTGNEKENTDENMLSEDQNNAVKNIINQAVPQVTDSELSESLMQESDVHLNDVEVDIKDENKNESTRNIPDNVNSVNSITIGEEELKNLLRCHHSRKFRDYCDHIITTEIQKNVASLLEDIVKFQDRQFARNPLKAAAKRRHVTGLKEVKKYSLCKKMKLIIIAPDLENVPSKGGLDDMVREIKEIAIKNEIPYVFALLRRNLGYVLKKKVPVSCVGILNYEGAEEYYKKLISDVQIARMQYKNQFTDNLPCVENSLLPQECSVSEGENVIKEEERIIEETKKDVNEQVVASLLAKLTEKETIKKKVANVSPFLRAIEKHSAHDEEAYFSAEE